MAQGTFAPIYMHVEMDLIARHERVLLDILRGLAWHADELGMCWPGHDRLAEVTRRSRDTIKGYIEQLLDLDMIRVHQKLDPIRRTMQRTYQVSPYVMYVREELEPQALELWLTGENVINEMGSLTKHRQPESEPETEPESNQKQGTKNRTTTTTRSRKNSASTKSADRRPTASTAPDRTNGKHGKHPDDQPQSGDQTNVIPRTQPTGGQPAANGRGKQSQDLSAYKSPLPDAAAELLAGRIARRFSTRETQARLLVCEYGRDQVEVAVRWIDEEIAKDRVIDKPFGLMKWWLRENVIIPSDIPQAENASGQYGDFFER